MQDCLPFWGNTASGEISVEEPPAVLDFRGGLFCDEPVSSTVLIAWPAQRCLRGKWLECGKRC